MYIVLSMTQSSSLHFNCPEVWFTGQTLLYLQTRARVCESSIQAPLFLQWLKDLMLIPRTNFQALRLDLLGIPDRMYMNYLVPQRTYTLMKVIPGDLEYFHIFF